MSWGMKEGMIPVSMMASLIVAVTLRRKNWGHDSSLRLRKKES